MKIKYVYYTTPHEECIIDSKIDYEIAKNLFCNVPGARYKRTPEQHEKHLLKQMEEGKKAGRILSYEIMEDEAS